MSISEHLLANSYSKDQTIGEKYALTFATLQKAQSLYQHLFLLFLRCTPLCPNHLHEHDNSNEKLGKKTNVTDIPLNTLTSKVVITQS